GIRNLRTHTSLLIQHPSRELCGLVEELEKIPNAKICKGVDQSMRNRKVSFKFEEGWLSALVHHDLPDEVERIVDAIYPHKLLIEDLVADGGSLSMRIGWHVDSHIGASFRTRLLQKLTELAISLDYFVYVGEEQQASHNEQCNRIAERIRNILHKHDPSGIIN